MAPKKVIKAATKKADERAKDALRTVVKEIKSADRTWLSTSRNGLLVSICPALKVIKEDRLPEQKKLVDIIGDALREREGQLKEKFDQAQSKVDNSENENNERKRKVDDAKVEKNSFEEKLKENKEALESATKNEHDMKKAVQERIAAEQQCDKIYNSLVDMKQKVELISAAFQIGANMKLDGKAPAQKIPKTFIKSGKELGLEMSMLTTLPDILGKQPDHRSEFETFTVSKFGEALDKLGEVYSKEAIDAEDDKKKQRAADVEAAKENLTKATQHKEECAQEIIRTKKEIVGAEKAIGEAQKSVDSFGKDVKRYKKENEEASEELTTFREGPLASYEELKDNSSKDQEIASMKKKLAKLTENADGLKKDIEAREAAR